MIKNINFTNLAQEFSTQTTIITTNPGEKGESHFQICHIIILKMSNLKKNYKACKETWKYGPYTGEKAKNRNCPGGNPDTGLINTLNQLFYMYSKR